MPFSSMVRYNGKVIYSSFPLHGLLSNCPLDYLPAHDADDGGVQGLKEDIQLNDGLKCACLVEKVRGCGVIHALLSTDAVPPCEIVSGNQHYMIFRLQ